MGDTEVTVKRETMLRYFRGVRKINYERGTPDWLQGGISVIRAPHEYNDETLAYWYNLCKARGSA